MFLFKRSLVLLFVSAAVVLAVWFLASFTPEQPSAPVVQEEQTQESPTEAETLPLPASILHPVPFASQAPFGDWSDPRQQDGCEEASVIMAMAWVRGENLTREQMLEEIIKTSGWQEENYGTYHDTSAEDTMRRIFKEYYSYEKVRLTTDVSVEAIKKELAAGNLVLAPFNGQALGNLNYTGAGPERHFMVILGYDDRRGEFITNDPGTRRGEGYRYLYQRLFNSIRDYPTGYHVPIEGTQKAMLVVEK